MKKAILESNSRTKVTVAALDIVDRAGVESLFAQHAPIDVVAHCAGHLVAPNKISEGKFEDFRRAMEINVTGLWNLANSFPRHAREDATGAERPAFITMSTATAHFPAGSVGFAPASYVVSKICGGQVDGIYCEREPTRSSVCFPPWRHCNGDVLSVGYAVR